MTPDPPASPPRFELGDLPVGRILDEALALTRRYGWSAVVIGFVPILPILIGKELLSTWLFGQEGPAGMVAAFLSDWVMSAMVGGLFSAPLSAGAIYLFATAYLGRPVTIGEGFRHAARCWLAIAPAYLVLTAMAYAGFIFMCYIPGILLMTALYLHIPVMSLERAGPFAAFGRGFALMGGRVGVIFLLVLADVGLNIVLSGIAMSMGPTPVYAVAMPLLRGPVWLYFTAVTVVVYLSARSRHESIDLQILADDIAAEAGEPEAFRL